MELFVNNFSTPIELGQGVSTLDLDLPDGKYRLSVSDDFFPRATRWEIVLADVHAGVATLERGYEGTTDQDWLDGCVAYITVTAGFLVQLQQQIEDLGRGRHSILDLAVPDGGLAVELPSGVGHVNCYLEAEEPQPVRLVVPPLQPLVGVSVGQLRVNMEGVATLGISVPASAGMTFEWVSAQYDNQVIDVTFSGSTYSISLLEPNESWCVLIEFSIADFTGDGGYAVVAYIYSVAPNGPGNATTGWLPPDPV